MSRRSRLWWFRQPWPWKVADVLNRLGWCWSDLVDWALQHDRNHPEWNEPEEHRLRYVDRRSTCAREADTRATGHCYCGQARADVARCLPGGAP